MVCVMDELVATVYFYRLLSYFKMFAQQLHKKSRQWHLLQSLLTYIYIYIYIFIDLAIGT